MSRSHKLITLASNTTHKISIEQARGRSHEEDSSQIFMLDDMQFGGVWTLSRLKQKKIKNYQTKFNKIRKLSREQTLVPSTHPPKEIRTNP